AATAARMNTASAGLNICRKEDYNAPRPRLSWRNRMRMKALVVAAVTMGATLVAALSAQDQTVRIRAAKILDGTGRVLSNATIVVQGSKITAIETGNAGTAT